VVGDGPFLISNLGLAWPDHVSDASEVMGLYPTKPHDRYAVGDLVGLIVANRGCGGSAASLSGRALGG
jgi:hypothetical protein